MLITIIATSLSITYYAWSKYQSAQKGEDGIAQVAKWRFELRAEETKTSPAKPFVMARTDEYGHVIVENLAPGTYGEIPIFVDMTGTEVLTKLELTITITDCPRNIKFYKTEDDRTNNEPISLEKTVDENEKYVTTVKVEKYYSIDDENAEDYVGKVHNETIYWNWEYETLDADNSSIEGDEIDREDSGKEAQIVITVKATEVLEKRLKLNELTRENAVDHYGDVVDYHAEGLTYRLFYIDWDNDFGDGAGTIYLKADGNDENVTELTTNYTPVDTEGYNGYKDLTVFKNMNKKWKIADGVIDGLNETGAGWLCSPSKWTKYAENDRYSGYVNYAIGGPSTELYIASYNEKYKKENNTNVNLLDSMVGSDGNGYKYAPAYYVSSEFHQYSKRNILSTQLGKGMYVKTNEYFWLASPSLNMGGSVCRVCGGGEYALDCNNYFRGTGFCPVVSLKSNTPIEIID